MKKESKKKFFVESFRNCFAISDSTATTEVTNATLADKIMSETSQVKVSIYTLSDPRDGQVRYVGKAVAIEKRIVSHIKDEGKTYKANWIKQLRSLGLKPVIEVIEEVQESDWKEAERFWIESFRQFGFKLTNGTYGGEGGKWMPEIIKRFSEKQRLRTHPPEIRAKISRANKGKPFTEKMRQGVSNANRSRVWTEESRLKCGRAAMLRWGPKKEVTA